MILIRYLALVGVCLSLHALPLGAENGRPVVEKRDDLPRHTYQLDVPVVELYQDANREVLLRLAREVQVDARRDLDTYDIRDETTLQEFYSVLGNVAILEGRWRDYLDYLARRRELESKEANRLTMGLFGEALATVKLAAPENEARALEAELDRRINTLPYETVQDNIKASKGSSEIVTEALILGDLESSLQPVLDNTGGEISYDIATSLVSVAFTLDHYVPNRAIVTEVYGDYLAAHKVEKVDIWKARKVALSADEAASEVVISVWDSGVDIDIPAIRAQLWTNGDEIPGNGIDDDENGFVDDLHGFAYDVDAYKVPEILQPIEEKYGVRPQEWQVHAKGIDDITSNIDSPEAAELRKYIAGLPKERIQEFLESLNLYSGYAHGTHVSGIALEDNPFARLLVARMTYNHTQLPLKPTIEGAERDAAMFRAAGAYFRANGVRVVNMSWGGSLRGVESALEAHNVGETPEARKTLARKIYDIANEGLRDAIGGSPDILFITSAGNSDNDVRFDEYYPSSFEFPNILSVGAVDIAGDETSFTSLGKVDIYANGFEVESYVPGGDRLPLSGTSMSSPQVTNLASKLLALAPDLSVAELRRLIIEGADEKPLETRTIRLMNPKASVALLRQRQLR